MTAAGSTGTPGKRPGGVLNPASSSHHVGMTDTDTTAAPPFTLESPDGRSVVLRGERSGTPRVGDFLEVATDQVRWVVFVDDVTTNPNGTFAAAGSLTHFKHEAPGPAALSVTVRPAATDDIAPLLTNDDERLHVGVLARRPDIQVSIVPKRLNRHTFWCGQSGSGKTYALGVTLERILSGTGLPVVIFDPNSDFVSLNTSRDDADPDESGLLQGRDITILRPDDPDSPLRVRFTDFSARAKAAVLRLDPVIDRAEYNALLHLTPELDGIDADEIVKHLQDLGSPEAAALLQRIENLGLLDWTRTWAQSSVSATEVIAQRPAATVLDLGGYERHEEQLTVALGVLDDLWARRTERRPVLLVLDEAHNLCPPDPDTPLGVAVRDRLIQIAAEGRKFGLWLLISTQRPSKVHPGIVSQCDNLTLMRMNSRADLDVLAQTFGFVPEGLLRQAARFGMGEALLAGGFVALPSVVKVRARVTAEGGTDVPVPLL